MLLGTGKAKIQSMATSTIRLSDDAPAEAIHFTLFGAEFDLGGSGRKTYETDNELVLGNASSHPWLVVERPKPDVSVPMFADSLDPKDDAMSSVGGINVNDPDEVRKSEEAKADPGENKVAIQAGLHQTDVVKTGGIAETVAADDSSKTSDKVKDN